MNPLTKTLPAVAGLLLLVGCTAPVGEPTDETPVDQTGGDADIPCLVGTWTLDVPAYATESAAFLGAQGVPVEDFEMSGAGEVTFTEAGRITTDIDLLVNATLDVEGMAFPIEQRTAYTGEGDWSESADGTIDLENWTTTPASGGVEEDGLPTIDFFDIPSMTATCTADTLVLRGPDAPLTATWHR